jgi:hypothetical protein
MACTNLIEKFTWAGIFVLAPLFTTETQIQCQLVLSTHFPFLALYPRLPQMGESYKGLENENVPLVLRL